ncbi:MAG: hypothetical protein WD887_00350 [Candidatus Saccharimonadales bacterium]
MPISLENGSFPPKLEELFHDMPEALSALEDFKAHVEESVTAAAYDERVEGMLRPVVLSGNEDMPVPDFMNLQHILMEEYGLHGDNLVRAIYRCSKHIKREEGLTKVFN